tara:strand:+ start:1366 stop:2514 length:1149 start_codon:yes stop_codon:yes gene_type:complete
MKKYLLTLIVILCFITSCNDNTDTIDTGPAYDRESLLSNWHNNHIYPNYNNFSSALSNLKSTVDLAKSSEGFDKPSLSELRRTFIETYSKWQHIEMFNIGKAEEIYYNSTMNIYPVNTARVESNVESGNYDLQNPNNYAAQGLPTLDYLLFGIGSNDTEVLENLNSKYLNYLSSVVDEMSKNTSAVVNDWETYKNEFLSSTENTATSAVNLLVNDFIYYYEKGFRANKLGIPGGVFSSSPIPENIELYYGMTYCNNGCGVEFDREDFGTQMSSFAMTAVRDFFEGTNTSTGASYNVSLKSILAELDSNTGQDNLGNRISSKLKIASDMMANDIDSNYYRQIVSDNNKFLQTYDAIQEVVVLLKVDMLQFLSINVDYVDADGD